MQLGSYFISPSLPDKNDKPCLHVHTATNNKPQSYHRASCCPGLDELLAGSHTDMFIAANVFFAILTTCKSQLMCNKKHLFANTHLGGQCLQH